VRYYEASGETEAMDAEGLRIRVQRHANVDKAPLTFWRQLVRRALVERRALAADEEGGDERAYVLSGTRDVGGQATGYLAAVRRSDRGVVVFQAWGPQPLFATHYTPLRNSAISIDPSDTPARRGPRSSVRNERLFA
jgi:hypothetical protein